MFAKICVPESAGRGGGGGRKGGGWRGREKGSGRDAAPVGDCFDFKIRRPLEERETRGDTGGGAARLARLADQGLGHGAAGVAGMALGQFRSGPETERTLVESQASAAAGGATAEGGVEARDMRNLRPARKASFAGYFHESCRVAHIGPDRFSNDRKRKEHNNLPRRYREGRCVERSGSQSSRPRGQPARGGRRAQGGRYKVRSYDSRGRGKERKVSRYDAGARGGERQVRRYDSSARGANYEIGSGFESPGGVLGGARGGSSGGRGGRNADYCDTREQGRDDSILKGVQAPGEEISIALSVLAELGRQGNGRNRQEVGDGRNGGRQQ